MIVGETHMRHTWALACALLLGTTGVAAGPANGEGTADPDPARVAVAQTEVTPQGFFWQLTMPQDVVAGSVLIALPESARGAEKKKRAGRSDEELFTISSTGSNDVPDAALRAYRHAADVMGSCGISWQFLAAIGRVESNHGRFGGSQLGSDGVSRPEILGPQLNGAGPFAAIGDSDGGTLDGDKKWDRAVGQMQFIPGTWRMVARDGDGDGRQDPQDIDDSALAAAVYLCGAGDLSTLEGKSAAAWRYNQSSYYVALVLSFTQGYETGVFSVPAPPPPPEKAKRVKKVAPTPAAKPTKKPTKKHIGPTSTVGSTPAPRPTPKPVAPPQTPSPAPTPSQPPPSGPDLQTLQGPWSECVGGYCVNEKHLDLGARGGDQAHADYDGDGNSAETNAEEFAGLVGQAVSLRAVVTGSDAVVYLIGGKDYRRADGSFA